MQLWVENQKSNQADIFQRFQKEPSRLTSASEPKAGVFFSALRPSGKNDLKIENKKHRLTSFNATVCDAASG
jgi:hypothetical protein